jgi:hypothetical protein
LWKEILLNVGRVPNIAQAYDLAKIFAWMASIAGLKNINQFKIQVLPPGQLPAPGSVAIDPNAATRMPMSAPQDTGVMS